MIVYSEKTNKMLLTWLEKVIKKYIDMWSSMKKSLDKEEQKVVKGYIKDCTEELVNLKMKSLGGRISKNKFELLSTSALYVVMKFIAGYDWISDNISPKFFSDMTPEATQKEIVAVERDLLKTTNWQLCPTITAILENETMPFLV